MLSVEFPFSERRILGGLFRAPLQFLSANFAFSEHRISIFEGHISSFSMEFAFSERRIQQFLSATFEFSERIIYIFERRISIFWHGICIF